MQHPFAVQAFLFASSVFLLSPCAEGHVVANVRSQQHSLRQAPEALAAGTTTTLASTTDVGKAYVRAADDIAWKAAGAATLSRAATSKLRSRINKIGAKTHQGRAMENANAGVNLYGPMAVNAEAAAQASLNQALAYEEQVKQIVKTVDEHAYKAAKASADKEVAKLEAEGKKYFESLIAKFKALADPGPPTPAQAAAKAAQPYIDVELRVGALVQYYNEKATTNIAQAQQMVMQAQTIATQAQGEQTAGIVDMAQRHMMQAHMLIGAANLKKGEALKVRKLAESLNMSIPSYQRAAQQAAAHALATFTGLQMDDKSHAEMRKKVAESTHQVEEGLRALDSALADVAKLLSDPN
jgi:hypothetical protein